MAKYILLNEVTGYKPGDILDSAQDPVDALRANGAILAPFSLNLQSLAENAARLYNAGSNPLSVFSSVASGYAIKRGANSLLWSPSGNGDVTDWDDVMLAVENSNAPLTIFGSKGETHVVPRNSTPYELKDSVFEFPLGDNSTSIISIEDGATLRNCSGGTGAFTFRGNPSVTPCFTWRAFDPDVIGSGQPAIFLQQFGNVLSNNGSVPMVQTPDNSFLVYAGRYGGGFVSGSGAPAISLGNLGFLLLTALGAFAELYNDAIIGGGTCTLGIQHDGCAIDPAPFLPNYLGFIGNIPFGKAGGAGPSSFRPLPLFGPLPVGLTYVDTTVATAKPLWYDGVANWLDVNGVIVP